jgi:SAM-dependent methyltransferase
MDDQALQRWFEQNGRILEEAYLSHEEPWRQSGFSGPVERWDACRRPIADCVTACGSFLDIGCANGFLLERLLRWTAERGLLIEPFGLDLSEKLAARARRRLPQHAAGIFVGNGFSWPPPRRFDYVRTELCYVPPELQKTYALRLLRDCVAPGGVLLVAEYRGRRDDSGRPWVDRALRSFGLPVARTTSGSWEGLELTRVACVLADAVI